MDSIEGDVNRIMQARREYNKAVNTYNREVNIFGKIYLVILKFDIIEEFKADESAHSTIVVKFEN